MSSQVEIHISLGNGENNREGVNTVERKLEKDNDKTMPSISRLPMSVLPVNGIISDPMGSYTGIPEDPFETPVQDADDL